MDDVWPTFERDAVVAGNGVEVRLARPDDGQRTLAALGVTAGSALGAFALHTEITFVDHGWLRLLGAGGPATACSLRGLMDDNLPLDLTTGLVVAFDVVGGFYALNGGGLPGERGEVCFLAPDSLEWERTELGHGDWVRWSFSADLQGYYRDLRWDGWREEIASLPSDHGLHLYPPPFSAEGADVAAVSRRSVPVHELWYVAQEFRRQLGIE